MADSPAAIDLEALDAYLMSDMSPDDCMLLCDLDGFLTGVVVGPEPIPTSEWMSAIWGGDEPQFESEQQMRTVLGTIMGRYNDIAATMSSDPDSFEPILEQWPDGDVVVTDWAAGFLDAIKLRHKAWEPLFKDREARILLVPLVILGDDDDFFEHHPSSQEKEFYASAPDMLLNSVIYIHDFWQDRRPNRQKPNPRRQRGGRR